MTATITLAHGNGGLLTRSLICDVIAPLLTNPFLDVSRDAAALSLTGDWMVTSDGFSVLPLEFPGGSIGTLAVYGTVNDLAVSGARARFMTLNILIEEGFLVVDLQRLVAQLAASASECGVDVIAGDTKVIPRTNAVPTLYMSATGLGPRVVGFPLGFSRIQAGDAVIVSGGIGEHGTAVMLARAEFGVNGNVRSDCGSVWPLVEKLSGFGGLRFMRDPTRGGLATLLHEVAAGTGFGIRVTEVAIPVHPQVRGLCELLGLDPLYLACEGRIVVVCDPAEASSILSVMKEVEIAESAALIGYIDKNIVGVVLETEFGGSRYLEELSDDPLPRIC